MGAVLRYMAVALIAVAACAIPAGARSGRGWQRLPDDPLGANIALATVGADGKIYILGGDPPTFNYRTELHEFTVRTHAWAKLASLYVYFDGLAAVDSQIYAVGGDQTGSEGSETAIYSVSKNRWMLDGQSANHPFPHLSQCMHAGGAATLGHDGRIYIVAGGDTLNLVGNCLEAFDPHTHVWAQLPSLPFAVYLPAATTGIDGRIYVLGGVTTDPYPAATNRVEAYSPSTNTWTTLAPMPTARAGLAAVTGPDGTIFAIGGSPDPIDFLPSGSVPRSMNVVEVYNPRTSRWSRTSGLRVPRYQLSAVMAPDGKIYAIGGFRSDAVETYDVLSGTGRG